VKILIKSEDGQALVITLLCLTILLGFAGLATDVGTLFYAKRQLQSAADSAALAGASEAALNNNTLITNAAKNDAATNGATDGTNGVTVTVHHPYTPAVCTGTCNANNYVEVIVQQTQRGGFMSLFTSSPVVVAARAVGYLKNNPGCFFTLDPAASGSFNMSGGFFIALQAPNCSIYIDSNSSNALTAGFLDSITAKSIGIVGNYNSGFFSFINPHPVTGIVPVSDPLAYLTPPANGVCLPARTNVVVTTAQTLSPGTYCGTGGNPAIKLSGPNGALVTFNPGTYVINGGGVATGGLLIQNTAFVTGTGVTFYFTNSASFNINGFGITLKAPGPAAAVGIPGVLFFQDRTNFSPATVGGFISFVDLEGAIYVPNGTLNLTNFITATISNYGIYVTKNLNLQGAIGALIDYANASGSGGTSPIKGVVLVE
jgi:Flp pilus assembly protein TadG